MLTGVAMVFEPTLQLLAEDKRPKTRWARYSAGSSACPPATARILLASLALQIVAVAAPA